jgi:dTDP-4-amino-4,6-dideoxygalactose transaminase
MTTGEGGMITTNDDALAERMRLLTLHGMSRDAWKRYTSTGSWQYDVVAAGYKYNMTDIQAALGIHQLRRLDGFIEARQCYAQLYDKAFEPVPEIEPPINHNDRSHIYHLYVIRLNLEGLNLGRAEFIEELRRRNIGTSVHFIPVHLHSLYAERFGYLPGALIQTEQLYNRIISLPLYPGMTRDDVGDVIAATIDVVQSSRC